MQSTQAIVSGGGAPLLFVGRVTTAVLLAKLLVAAATGLFDELFDRAAEDAGLRLWDSRSDFFDVRGA